MVTLVILSSGIVVIYKTFFLCADYLNRLSTRLHASELVDAKIADITRQFRQQGDLSFSDSSATVTEEINHKQIDFLYHTQFAFVPNFEGLYRLTVGVSWVDAGHPAHFTRSTLVTL